MLARVSIQPGIGSETLRGWMKRADIDDGLRPGVASDERQHLLLALEPEIGALRRADGCHAPLLSSHVFQDHVMLPAVSEVAYIDEAIPGFVSQLVQAEARLVNGRRHRSWYASNRCEEKRRQSAPLPSRFG